MGTGSVRRRKRENRYGARFGAVARRYIGGNPVGSLGSVSVCYRSAEPESRSHVSEPAASSAAGTSSANDTFSGSGSDTASSPIATAKSSAVSEEDVQAIREVNYEAELLGNGCRRLENSLAGYWRVCAHAISRQYHRPQHSPRAHTYRSLLLGVGRSVDRGIRAIPLCLITTRRPRSDQRPLWDLPPSR